MGAASPDSAAGQSRTSAPGRSALARTSALAVVPATRGLVTASSLLSPKARSAMMEIPSRTEIAVWRACGLTT